MVFLSTENNHKIITKPSSYNFQIAHALGIRLDGWCDTELIPQIS